MKQTLIVAAVLSTFASQVQAQSQLGRFYVTTAMGVSHMSNPYSRYSDGESNTHGLGFKVVVG